MQILQQEHTGAGKAEGAGREEQQQEIEQIGGVLLCRIVLQGIFQRNTDLQERGGSVMFQDPSDLGSAFLPCIHIQTEHGASVRGRGGFGGHIGFFQCDPLHLFDLCQQKSGNGVGVVVGHGEVQGIVRNIGVTGENLACEQNAEQNRQDAQQNQRSADVSAFMTDSVPA